MIKADKNEGLSVAQLPDGKTLLKKKSAVIQILSV
jgi:hypothetical protein